MCRERTDAEETVTYKVGDLIRCNRKKAGLTQSQLGQEIGLGATDVSRVEAGRQNIGVPAFLKVCEIVDIDLSRYTYSNLVVSE